MEQSTTPTAVSVVETLTRPAPHKRSALVQVALVAVVVLVGTLTVLWIRTPPAPFTPSQAGLTGRTWVMPSSEVQSFLHRHGVETQGPPLLGTTVVGRVTWTQRPPGSNEYFTVLLGDKQVRAGYIEEAFGPSKRSFNLGNGSMWNDTLGKSRWLAGDRMFQTDSGWTSNSQFVSVPVSSVGPMWFVAHVMFNDPTSADGFHQPDAHPNPVLVVALSTGDHVWWAHRLP